MTGGMGALSSRTRLAVPASSVRTVIRSVLAEQGYSQITFNADNSATGLRGIKDDNYFKETSQFLGRISWTALNAAEVDVEITVRNALKAHRERNVRLESEIAHSLKRAGGAWARSSDVDREILPHDPITWPDDLTPYVGPYTGTARDYSACAVWEEVSDLTTGLLPLGRFHFGMSDPTPDAPPIFLGKYRTGDPMEYNGTIICAPQNSGKTQLIVRWAEAATRSAKGYATFIVDVKGNLTGKLKKEGLRGEVLTFATDPGVRDSDRINFLDGPDGLSQESTDRIRQLATAILPSRGFSGAGGEQEYFYQNRVTWLTALIHILKLCAVYQPSQFIDPYGEERSVDLCDLYELAADEDRLLAIVELIRKCEDVARIANRRLPDCDVAYWSRELALLVNPAKAAWGQRPPRDTYRGYTAGILAALEPFAPHSSLSNRVRSFGTGRLFDIESVLGGETRPVTIIISARVQDLDKAAAVLALTIKRLQWFLFDRVNQSDARKKPILLLLDETRRIRDFDAPEFVSFAREAKAACVVAYQSLDQIGPPAKVTELLENVGTQIYLGSLVGNTARHFTSILPKRRRPSATQQVTRTKDSGEETSSTSYAWTFDDYLTPYELYHLPAGSWPALVYINDHPRRRPILTSMAEGKQDADDDDNSADVYSARATGPAPDVPPGTVVVEL